MGIGCNCFWFNFFGDYFVVVILFLFIGIEKILEMCVLVFVKLKEMGLMSCNEWIMLLVFVGLVILWVCGVVLNIDVIMIVFIGLVILLLSGVLIWDDVIVEKEVWYIVIWFVVLLIFVS